MYESKEKSKEEPISGKAALGDSKEDTQKASEGTAELLRALLKKVYNGENMGLSAVLSSLIFYTKPWARPLASLDYRSVSVRRFCVTVRRIVPAHSCLKF